MTAGPESGSRPGRRAGWWRVATTPLGDLARGRDTGPVPRTARAPHGWPHDVRAAGFPEPVTDLILRVVSGTRLWRRERQDVARELIAHFQDGLESSGDRDDDGGRMVSAPPRPGYGRASPAQLGGPMGRVEDGDWVLWPMSVREPLERDDPAPGAG